MLNSAEHEICPATKLQSTNHCKFFLAKHSWAWKFVGVFIFISRDNFMLCLFEHEKHFTTSGSGFSATALVHTQIAKVETNLCISTDLYSWLSLSRPRLSRITAYLEVKIRSLPIHENLTTDGKYCRKEEKLLLRSNFSSFPQYFQYISNFKSPFTYQFVKCG